MISKEFMENQISHFYGIEHEFTVIAGLDEQQLRLVERMYRRYGYLLGDKTEIEYFFRAVFRPSFDFKEREKAALKVLNSLEEDYEREGIPVRRRKKKLPFQSIEVEDLITDEELSEFKDYCLKEFDIIYDLVDDKNERFKMYSIWRESIRFGENYRKYINLG